ncbi:hypothetical protein GCM10010365_46150 [Streptomyces poonensis]|uniref:Uncharacterized protein n=1 Tax=Streptomyces poonensis TaxID=68255 RepID=A0A918PRV5_9ACTN|nr:hypothetical protein GCM10010365_46150 [Streptomyces poonensis]
MVADGTGTWMVPPVGWATMTGLAAVPQSAVDGGERLLVEGHRDCRTGAAVPLEHLGRMLLAGVDP